MLRYHVIYKTKSGKPSENRHSHYECLLQEIRNNTARGWFVTAVYDNGKVCTSEVVHDAAQ